MINGTYMSFIEVLLVFEARIVSYFITIWSQISMLSLLFQGKNLMCLYDVYYYYPTGFKSKIQEFLYFFFHL